MSTSIAITTKATALAASWLALALPQHGVVVPGQSLGGVRLGDRPTQVLARWGRSFGSCRGCRVPTWYFNYTPYQPQGAGVELAGGRVSAVFTLWSPPGWHTTKGLTTGDAAARVTELYGALATVRCGGYDALILPGRRATTVVYVVDDKVWGFGLIRAARSPCP